MSPLVHLLVAVMLYNLCSFCVIGNAVMFLPSFEVRTVPHVAPLTSTRYVPLIPNTLYQQNIQHVASDRQSPLANGLNFLNSSALFNYTKEAMDTISGLNQDTQEGRLNYARVADHADNPAYKLHHRSSEYGYQPQPPNYSSSTLSSYQSPEKNTVLTPIHDTSSKLSFPSGDLTSLVKPMQMKMASKASGLMEFVLTFLSSSSPVNLEMKGFKDLVINGIIKPLLIAKGGIKTLISKLTIPLISLLLINLEVLVTVWWLWEDCPQPKQQPEPYSPHHSYNYNMSYR